VKFDFKGDIKRYKQNLDNFYMVLYHDSENWFDFRKNLNAFIAILLSLWGLIILEESFLFVYYNFRNIGINGLKFFSVFMEEFLKFISILIGGPISYLYTLIFSVSEAHKYINNITPYWNDRESLFVTYRLLIIPFHFLTLAIQYKLIQHARKTNQASYAVYGFLAAFGLHMIFNNGLNIIILYIMIQITNLI
jgi:hypothetical protein